MRRKNNSIFGIVDSIDNALVQGFHGFQLAKEQKNEALMRHYAEIFLKALFNTEDEILSKFFEKMYYEPFLEQVTHVKPELLSSYLDGYVQMRSAAGKGILDATGKVVSNVEQIFIMLTPEARNGITKRLYHKAFQLTRRRKEFNDSMVYYALKYAEKKNDRVLIKKIITYCKKRIISIESLTNADHTKGRYQTIWEMVNKLMPSETERLKNATVIAELLTEKDHFPDKEKLSTTNEEIISNLEKTYELAVKLFRNDKRPEKLERFLGNKAVQERYATSPEVVVIAKAFVLKALSNEKVAENPWLLKEALEFTKVYGLAQYISQNAVRSSLVTLLTAGQLQTADEVCQAFSFPVTKTIVSKVVANLNTEIEKFLQLIEKNDEKTVVLNTYCYDGGKFKKYTEREDISKIRLLHTRINQVRDYANNGLMKIEDVPASNLHEDYGGKILLMEASGKKFLRINRKGEGMHSQIMRAFDDELRQLGFNINVEELGGAYIRIKKEDRTCVISDRSEDYGECDKQLAKSIVEAQFPDWTITTESYKKPY